MDILATWNTVLKPGKRSRRKTCRTCGKLIEPGERVTVEKIRVEKYYPVKGLMFFVKYLFHHANCKGK